MSSTSRRGRKRQSASDGSGEALESTLLQSDELSLSAAALHAGVSPSTLRRWSDLGIVQIQDGKWTTATAAHARIVSRLRDRGHSLESLKEAVESGRLAFGYVEELFPGDDERISLKEAAKRTGLEAALIERIFMALGYSSRTVEEVQLADVELLERVAEALNAGLPLVAFLQLARVYGQAMAQVADAEVRLFHLYVHEPLIRDDGVAGVEIADELSTLASRLLPLSTPIIGRLHARYLQHFAEQDIVSQVETDLEDESLDLGRLRVAIAFADLAGYTRLTEEEGDQQAVDAVERFVEAVELTLPEDARVIKTIGDEVMIVGSDATSLIDWAVGFQALMTERPLPRIGVHYGEALYRDGDYYGREINQAARVAARAAGGDVLVTDAVVEQAGSHLEFESIGAIKLKGFNEPTEIFLARRAEE